MEGRNYARDGRKKERKKEAESKCDENFGEAIGRGCQQRSGEDDEVPAIAMQNARGSQNASVSKYKRLNGPVYEQSVARRATKRTFPAQYNNQQDYCQIDIQHEPEEQTLNLYDNILDFILDFPDAFKDKIRKKFEDPNLVKISGCDVPPCKLRRRTKASIEYKFTPDEDAENIVNNVSASIFSVPLPFVGVDGTTACDNIFNLDGTSAGCSLKKGVDYIYKREFPVLQIYPTVSDAQTERRSRGRKNSNDGAFAILGCRKSECWDLCRRLQGITKEHVECTVTHWTNEGCFLRRWDRVHRRREIRQVQFLPIFVYCSACALRWVQFLDYLLQPFKVPTD
ncbi:hypothetical protein WN51_08646 [Melipona quadrifasciata]|uniref:MD-2-related lipid-recognition domain-containing protein n=1 Tax=Melipona quadrifasciata TaxID=166423 RepID=A0A0M9A7M9_9HYME|nr:hypothetical protein WN51_08646 [Melipona quadrifasciata]